MSDSDFDELKPPLTHHGEVTRAITGLNGDSDDDSEFDVDVDLPKAVKRIRDLGDYEIVSRIGAGGMGQVFRARHKTMDREVALKILPMQLSERPELVRQFYDEIRAVAKLMHPNIVTAFDAGCIDKTHFLAMELVDGFSLSSMVASHGPLSSATVIDVVAQAAAALQIAHEKGIVHRDIKPGNLMLTDDRKLKVLDFGLASLTFQVQKAKKNKQILGTVEYMAPEQIDQPEISDPRSDLYALGATMFYLLTGRTMFSGEPVQVALAQLKRKPPALYEVVPKIDLRMDGLYQRLVAKNPEHRFNTAKDLLLHLRDMDLLDLVENDNTGAIRSIANSLSSVGSITSAGMGTSTESSRFAAIGIDLGMMTSKASYIDSKRQLHEISFGEEGSSLKQFLWSGDGKIAIGEQASKKRATNPKEIFFGLQRWIGLPVVDRHFGDRKVPPEVLLAAPIKRIADSARLSQRNLTHAVVTVPGCYDQLHRTAIATACQIAGLEVLQLLDKPVAAAIAFWETQQQLLSGGSDIDSDETGRLLVVSLGGAASEASVVELHGDVARARATVGDLRLGKMRWQNKLVEYFADLFMSRHGIDVRKDLTAASRIQRSAELAVDRLIAMPKIKLTIEVSGKSIEHELTRESFCKIMEPLIVQLRDITAACLEKAGCSPEGIHHLILTGDMMAIPLLQKMIQRLLPRNVPVQRLGQSDIARGAALQARHLLPPRDMTVPSGQMQSNYDIAVVRLAGRKALTQPFVLLPRGSELPATVSRRLRLESSGTIESEELQIVESTRNGKDWHRLGSIGFARAFPNLKPTDPLQLRLELDSSGLLQGSVTWIDRQMSHPITATSTPSMDAETMRHWGNWLETLLMASDD